MQLIKNTPSYRPVDDNTVPHETAKFICLM